MMLGCKRSAIITTNRRYSGRYSKPPGERLASSSPPRLLLLAEVAVAMLHDCSIVCNLSRTNGMLPSAAAHSISCAMRSKGLKESRGKCGAEDGTLSIVLGTTMRTLPPRCLQCQVHAQPQMHPKPSVSSVWVSAAQQQLRPREWKPLPLPRETRSDPTLDSTGAAATASTSLGILEDA